MRNGESREVHYLLPVLACSSEIPAEIILGPPAPGPPPAICALQLCFAISWVYTTPMLLHIPVLVGLLSGPCQRLVGYYTIHQHVPSSFGALHCFAVSTCCTSPLPRPAARCVVPVCCSAPLVLVLPFCSTYLSWGSTHRTLGILRDKKRCQGAKALGTPYVLLCTWFWDCRHGDHPRIVHADHVLNHTLLPTPINSCYQGLPKPIPLDTQGRNRTTECK